MDYFTIQPTSKVDDIVGLVDQICSGLPKDDKIKMLMDQLNTHKSEGLVR